MFHLENAAHFQQSVHRSRIREQRNKAAMWSCSNDNPVEHAGIKLTQRNLAFWKVRRLEKFFPQDKGSERDCSCFLATFDKNKAQRKFVRRLGRKTPGINSGENVEKKTETSCFLRSVRESSWNECSFVICSLLGGIRSGSDLPIDWKVLPGFRTAAESKSEQLMENGIVCEGTTPTPNWQRKLLIWVASPRRQHSSHRRSTSHQRGSFLHNAHRRKRSTQIISYKAFHLAGT